MLTQHRLARQREEEKKMLPLNFQLLNCSPINIFLFIQWAEQWEFTESTSMNKIEKSQKKIIISSSSNRNDMKEMSNG